MRKLIHIAAAALCALLLASPRATAATTRDQERVLDRASRTVEDMQHDPAFRPIRGALDRARAILIVPELVKGGFIIGAEGGQGALVARMPNGEWSDPAFYTMGSASIGFQAGVERAEVVLLIMSDRALRAIEQNNFKIGAGAGLAVINVGEAAEAATTRGLSGDILVWSSAQGLYGGITLNGSVISPKREWNAEFYGRPAPVGAILSGRVHSPEANRLSERLAELTGPRRG